MIRRYRIAETDWETGSGTASLIDIEHEAAESMRLLHERFKRIDDAKVDPKAEKLKKDKLESKEKELQMKQVVEELKAEADGGQEWKS